MSAQSESRLVFALPVLRGGYLLSFSNASIYWSQPACPILKRGLCSIHLTVLQKATR